MEKEAKSNIYKVKERLVGKDLFIMVEETTDRCARAMTAILCGPLDGKFLERPLLIELLDVESANNENIQQAITGALFKVLGNDLDYSKIRLLLTDGAAYCLKAGRGLKQMFPNLLHLTCLAHGLNRVAETVRYENPLVDQLIAEVKKIFVKAPGRKKALAAAGQVPVPEPILTR